MTDSILKPLTYLVNAYKSTKCVTATDFLENYLNNNVRGEQTEVIKAFLGFCQREMFVEDIAKIFLKECRIYHANIHNVKVHVYFVIFLLNEENMEEIVTHSQYYTKDLLQFLLTDEHHKEIARHGCKYFENKHVIGDIIKPFLGKLSFVNTLIDKIAKQHFIKPPAKVTGSVKFKFSQKLYPPAPPPPTNAPSEYKIIHAKKPPLSTEIPHTGILKKIEEEHVRNKKKAERLLEESSNVSKRLVEPKKALKQLDEPKPTEMKVKPPPPKKDILIKENLTTTLRAASRLLKQQEDEIKTLDEILKGGCALQKIEQVEVEYRKLQNQQELDNIQRKRLQGLLSYEEAIIAKKKLFDENKKRVEEYKSSRATLLQQLEEWKYQEQEKIKEHIGKCHKLKQDLKQIERQHLEEKQSKVRMHQYATKKMLQKAFKQKTEELARKVALIQEIKAIHEASVRMNAKKEFDPTETQNLGLFCEMSIAELQERLVLMKMKMKDELVAKRQQILCTKAKQQEAIANVRNFMAQNRRISNLNTKTVPIFSPKLERSPSLLRLEKLLHEKKSLRMKIT